MIRWVIILLLFLPLLSWTQSSINGKVQDAHGAIPGATIQLIGTTFGAVSDVNGRYEILNIPTGVYSLEIRSVGFKPSTQEIRVTSTPINLSSTLTETTLTMDEVVVTGTMRPTFVSQSPVKIDVITSNYLNKFIPAASSSIVEGVTLINGVQEVVACGVCFTNSISINGLPGPYTAILMDGTPMYGNLASVYGLNGIPSMIIDRFEVIKGPSSTLYGSEAVAGVINIITKDPSTQPLVSIDIMGTSHLESFGNLSIAPRLGKSSGFIGVNYAYINDFDDNNGDGFGDNVNLDRVSFFTKWNINRASGKKLSIAGKYYYEDRRNGVREYLQNRNYQSLRGDTQVYGESIYTHRLELFGSYELPAVNHLRMDYSMSTHRQDSYYGNDQYIASQDILFANLIWDKDFDRHQLTGGFSQRLQVYDDNTVATEMNGLNHPDRQYIPGVYLQDEWAISERFTLLSGGRLDQYAKHGIIFSPRLSTKYKPGQWTTLRSNFGTGFRIVNLFTEDHAFVTGQRQVVIEEELRPEESYNLSVNANHLYTIGSGQGMVDIDAYFTYFTNKITPDYDQDPQQIVYSNTNGHAISKGIGLNIQHEFKYPLAFNLGFNIQDVTEKDNGVTSKIPFAPNWTGILTSNYTFNSSKFSISYTARITGPMSLPTVYDLDDTGVSLANPRPTKSAPYGIHNIQVSKEFSDKWSIYGGIQNLFNFTQPWSPLTAFDDPNASPGFSDRFDTAYAYAPIHGRELYIGIKWGLR
jgi:outer membrane receptor for ferrienterochelin and colicins